MEITWPIFIDPTRSNNVIDEYKNIHKPGAPKGVKVDLKAGDMLIYSGCELEHWREPLRVIYAVRCFCIIIMQMEGLQSLICMIKDQC